jgi:hypothetical protein
MTTETLETVASPPEQADPEIVEQQETETPEAESAAPESTEAAAPAQIEVTEAEKPDYVTRAELEERDRLVAERAAADALELDRRRRQTEGARKAQQQERAQQRLSRVVDTAKASLGAQGIFEDPGPAIINAIDREVEDRVTEVMRERSEPIDAAWEYITLPVARGRVLTDAEINAAFSELGDHEQEAVKRLQPRVQALINNMRPVIEAEARKGYVAEKDLPKKLEELQAARAAKSRNGETDIVRVEGQPAVIDRSIAAVNTRVSKGIYDEEDARIASEYVARIRNR